MTPDSPNGLTNGSSGEPAGDGESRQHTVQFYDLDESLCDVAARFLLDGLRHGCPILVLATNRHRAALTLRLEAHGVDVGAGRRSGRIVMGDAESMLSSYMNGDTFDVELARAKLSEVLDAAGTHGPTRGHDGDRPIHVYAEMVDLLWRGGNRSAALRLEQLWNELRATRSFQLLCASKHANFFEASDAEYFERLCALHTHVVPAESYSDLSDPHARCHEIARLQQRARALETELAHREVLEQELRAASLATTRLLSSLGQELRSPMAPILTALARTKERGDTQSREELGVIERHLGQITRIVDELVDQGYRGGTIEQQSKPVDIGDVLVRALEMTSPLFAERRHQISLEVTCGSVHVIGDRRRLVQAVMNLLTNAAKYMEEGGHVDVRALRDEESVVIRVRDAGFGIPADLMPRLFEPLVPARASSDRRSRGHGLGLLIARQIVELHGGTVTAASDGLGKGTEVVIRLPAVEGMPPRPGVVSPPESARAAQRPLRVLVVDPSADGADVLADYLGWLGHGTAVAVDAYDALEIAERFRPDVAMIDFGLPGMDGFELARLLRERAERLTLVAVTGRDQAPDHEATRGAGFHAHLVKPIDASVVAPLLDALMGR